MCNPGLISDAVKGKGVSGEGHLLHISTWANLSTSPWTTCAWVEAQEWPSLCMARGVEWAQDQNLTPCGGWKENCVQISTGTLGILCGSGLWEFYHSPGFLNWERPLCLSLWASIKQKPHKESLTAMFTLLQQLTFSLPSFLPPWFPNQKSVLQTAHFHCAPRYSIKGNLLLLTPFL